MKKAALIVYYLLFGFAYAGFFIHESLTLQLFTYSYKYVAFLAGFGCLGLLPPLLIVASRVWGTKQTAYACTILFVLGWLVYGGVARVYYCTQEHLFDPYLQMPPPDFAPDETQDASAVRILALGGSTTECTGIDAEQAFPCVLETMLREAYPDRQIQVLNAGKSWYTTQHSLINYVTNMREWQPHIVLVMHGINDIYRSFSVAGVSVGPYNRRWSHFYGPSAAGARPPTFEWFLLGRYLDSWCSRLRYVEQDLPLESYRSLGDFERFLATLTECMQNDRRITILMTQPSLYKDNMSLAERDALWMNRKSMPEKTGLLRAVYPSPESLAVAMDAYNQTVKRVAGEKGTLLIDLEAQIPKDLTMLFDDVHYTREGSQRVAETIATRLVNDGIIEQAVKMLESEASR